MFEMKLEELTKQLASKNFVQDLIKVTNDKAKKLQ